ncbi:hypothetical protein AB0M47_05095 [Hamadaea sp. NPDC051192]|uniref:hypothetical protein n=1 Tax=Hamadaea sp. NPDC051192 TaxID=3154940 RepID=UPI00343ABEFD
MANHPRGDLSAPDRPDDGELLPVPVLHLDSPIGVITGVRFVWSHRCRWCQVAPGLFTDDGRIEAGLAMLPLRRSEPLVVQWFTRLLPAAAPEIPVECPQPACRHPRVRKLPSGPLAPYPWLEHVQSITAEPMLVESTPRQYRPVPAQVRVTGMLAQIWRHVRRAEPRLAMQADELSVIVPRTR